MNFSLLKIIIFSARVTRGIICKFVKFVNCSKYFIYYLEKNFLKIKYSYYSINLFIRLLFVYIIRVIYFYRSIELAITSIKILLMFIGSCYLSILLLLYIYIYISRVIEGTSLCQNYRSFLCVDLLDRFERSSRNLFPIIERPSAKLNSRNLLRKRGPLKIDVEHYSTLI